MSDSEIYQFIAILLLFMFHKTLSLNIIETQHNILKHSRAEAGQSRIFYVRSKLQCAISCKSDESCVMANFAIINERALICDVISVSSAVSHLSTTEQWQTISKIICRFLKDRAQV